MKLGLNLPVAIVVLLSESAFLRFNCGVECFCWVRPKIGTEASSKNQAKLNNLGQKLLQHRWA